VATKEHILSKEDWMRIREDAAKQVNDERKKESMALALREAVDDERAKYDEKLEQTEITIDIPAYSKYILINRKYYYHGETYTISRCLADSIRDQMAQCWSIEKLAGNPNLKDYKAVNMGSVSAHSGTASPPGKLVRV
jgi:hypothetical protein